MGAGAVIGASRPAAIALCVAGAIALALALGIDLPASRSAGEIGRDFLEARAEARSGLWAEIAGGLLAIAVGVAVLRGARPARRQAMTTTVIAVPA